MTAPGSLGGPYSAAAPGGYPPPYRAAGAAPLQSASSAPAAAAPLRTRREDRVAETFRRGCIRLRALQVRLGPDARPALPFRSPAFTHPDPHLLLFPKLAWMPRPEVTVTKRDRVSNP